jgi:hypothetical protein
MCHLKNRTLKLNVPAVKFFTFSEITVKCTGGQTWRLIKNGGRMYDKQPSVQAITKNLYCLHGQNVSVTESEKRIRLGSAKKYSTVHKNIFTCSKNENYIFILYEHNSYGNFTSFLPVFVAILMFAPIMIR